ncbi:MAG: MerC domain-containing protein [Betaproteobacteria bacterium]|nr:MerC domain-containing protein [Betaproteobacteria bacterium]
MDAVFTLSARASVWDRIGVGMSGLCIAHCLAVPFIATLLPLLGAMEYATHTALAIGIAAVGGLAFVPGYRRHRRIDVPALAAAGIGMIVLSLLLPEGPRTEALETWLTVGGGTLMIFSHLRNAYFCRLCPDCGGDKCQLDAPHVVERG